MNHDLSDDDFWGTQRDWVTDEQRPRRPESEHPTSTTQRLRDWWNNTTTSVPITRRHGDPTGGTVRSRSAPSSAVPARHSDDAYELHVDPFDFQLESAAEQLDEPSGDAPDIPTAAGMSADPWADDQPGDDRWSPDVSTQLDSAQSVSGADRARMIDPLLARIGAALVVTTLLVPVAIGLGDGDGDGGGVESVALAVTGEATTEASTPSTNSEPSSTAPVSASSTADPATSDVRTDEDVTSPSTGATEPTIATDADRETGEAALTASAAGPSADLVDAVVETGCSTEYDVVEGDYWIRLAEGSGVSITDLLAANDATSDSALYPGATICLPAGASMPPPPPVATNPPAPSTSAPKQTTPSATTPTTPAPTTVKPTRTTTPTTTPTPPANTAATPAEVQAIIRTIWPDDLEARAIEIAWRESNHNPTARSSCCYGLFQIHYTAHRSWLNGLGITSAEQLFDPEVNTYAAFALYQRAGGFGPWG
jgi:hypothetical protein